MAELNEEAVEQVIEGVQILARSFSTMQVAIASATSATVAFGVAYYAAQKKAELKWKKLAEDEIEVMRDHFEAKVTALKNEQDKGEMDEIITANGYTGTEVIGVTEEAKEVVEVVQADVVNVFEAPVPTEEEVGLPVWDFAKEVKARDPRVPYIIHQTEYLTAQKGYEQMKLTYFMDDDVLAGPEDMIIEDQDALVGVENLERFGHGSEDTNKVYVRNDVREVDLEIVRSNGSFAEEVHGFIAHSQLDHRRQPPWDG